MVRVAVCDDEQEILEELTGYLRDMRKEAEEGLEVRCFRRAEEIEDEIENGWPYHIVFLDIELGEQNGIRIARHIRDKHSSAVVIFVTGHEQYVYEVFEVQPFDFIRKPLQREKVESVLRRALKQCDIMPVWEYRRGGSCYRVPLWEICYFASDQREVRIQTRAGEQAYYGKLDEVEEKLLQLSENFIRISKSVIINMRYVREINYHMVRLEDGNVSQEFNISQAYRVRVRKHCMEIWKR